MSDEDWDSGFGKWVAVYLNGQGVPDRDVRGERVTDLVHPVLQRPPRTDRIHAATRTIRHNVVPDYRHFLPERRTENDEAVKMDATVEVCPRSVMLLKAG
jgi:isoamylase